MPTEPRLLFTHIPKTAGSSLRAIIERQYPKSTCLNIRKGNPTENLQILQALSQAERDALSCVIGHVHFGIHPLFPSGENVYMTMLRHPVKRIISNYYFARSKPIRRSYDLAMSLSLVEYAAHPTVNSITTRYIAGMTGATPESLAVVQIADENMLERAKVNLRASYKVIGFTEEFDASVLMMQKALGWGRVYYHSINTGKGLKNKEARPDLTPELIEALEAACPLDMALHRYALELYEAQKDAYGRDKLAADLAIFQRMNQRISPFLAFARRLRKTRLYRGIRRRLKL